MVEIASQKKPSKFSFTKTYLNLFNLIANIYKISIKSESEKIGTLTQYIIQKGMLMSIP